MLTRLYVDNFRTFQNFEWSPGPVALLIGRNGTGKTALFEVLHLVRGLVCEELQLPAVLPPTTCTRWDLRNQQRFELDVAGADGVFKYRLSVQQNRDHGENRIINETLHYGDIPLFAFTDGQIQLYKDSGQSGPSFAGNWRRSGLGTVVPGASNTLLTWFKRWLDGLVVLRPNPAIIDGRAEREDRSLEPHCGNFASWYRTMWQERPHDVNQALAALSSVLDGFTGLSIRVDERRIGWLRATFVDPSDPNRRKKDVALDFDELSDGQRALIVLYVVLHTQIEPDRAVLLDEPDNYTSLDEIQPFLMEALCRVQDRPRAQLFVISHNSQYIDQLAPNDGFIISREGGGPSRIRRFESGEALTPSEIVVRGGLSQGGET
jgi:energy-coupling factor transporter ATP-binding protein EcfA2